MKSFYSFFSEARKTAASERARKLGLKGDGRGGWVNSQGKLVARTQGGDLVFTDKKKPGTQEQPTSRPRAQSTPEPQQRTPETPDTGEGKSKEGETLTMVFGRFNPPTIGHKKVLDAAAKVAGDGDMVVYPSRSQDPKKNPLSPDAKVELMKMMFPEHEDAIVDNDEVKTIFDALRIADEKGYSNVNIIVGSDRAAEFESLAQKYNGELYNFDEIEVISAGERDEAESGVKGMSASKMRKAASEGDIEAFSAGMPDHLDDKDIKKIMSKVRSGMQMESKLWEIAPRFDWKNLRENYVSGNIFRLDSIVESLKTGLIGRVIRRGANHIICVTEDNIMFKSWVRDLNEYTERKMERKERVLGKPNTLTGTDGYFKYAADMTPGFEKGDKKNLQPGGKPYKGPRSNIKEFINKYRKKKG